ncbi:MAG: cold shock domain-containing protein [Bacteroidales bacterium]|jgi:cold shock CspA family protein|nr:cold shock domain-containing protein [Bacteroidales bacterium]
MGRSQETFGKKEVRNKKVKKRKEKEQRRAKKKSEGTKRTFDDMIAYVDEFGMISSTPPDPETRVDIPVESIELGATRNKAESENDLPLRGVVTFFNESKGYGFIRDTQTNDKIFVHASNLLEPVKENDIVVYEIGKGLKGITAMKVKLFKE